MFQGSHEDDIAVGRDANKGVARIGGSPGGARRTEIPHGLAGCNPGFQDSCPSDGWWTEQTLSLFPEGETVVMEWTPQVRHPLPVCHSTTGEAAITGCQRFP